MSDTTKILIPIKKDVIRDEEPDTIVAMAAPRIMDAVVRAKRDLRKAKAA